LGLGNEIRFMNPHNNNNPIELKDEDKTMLTGIINEGICHL